MCCSQCVSVPLCRACSCMAQVCRGHGAGGRPWEPRLGAAPGERWGLSSGWQGRGCLAGGLFPPWVPLAAVAEPSVVSLRPSSPCLWAPEMFPPLRAHWGGLGARWGGLGAHWGGLGAQSHTVHAMCAVWSLWPCGRCGHGERGDGRWFAPHQNSATGKEQDTKEWLEQANQLKCQRKTEAWYFLCLLSAVNRQAFLFPCLKSCHFNRLFSCRFFPCTFVNNPQTAEALLSQLIGVK